MMAGHDEGVPRVQLQDLLHLTLCQREVKELEVLLHTLLAGRLRYDDDTTLQEIAHSYLCYRLAMGGADREQGFIVEEFATCFGKGTPRH